MKLDYENKKSKAEILKKANSISLDLTSDFVMSKDDLIMQADNLLGLAYLIKVGYKGKIDLVYIDPPFATNLDFKISSGRNNTISMSKKGDIAYSDRLSDEDFLEFLRERVILIRELLSEQGSFYLHIDTKIGHYVKIILDEIFGQDNFINDITRKKSNPKNFFRKAYGNEKDVIFFYAKNKSKMLWNDVTSHISQEELEQKFTKMDELGRRYTTVPVHAPGETNGPTGGKWRDMLPPVGRHWRTAPAQLDEMDKKGLIEWSKTGNPRLKKYADEHKGNKIQDIWLNYKDPQTPDYPTQKNIDMLKMIVSQSSNPNSIVLDAFAGSGNTALAAQELGRHFIVLDQSETAINLMKKRLDNSFIYLNFYTNPLERDRAENWKNLPANAAVAL